MAAQLEVLHHRDYDLFADCQEFQDPRAVGFATQPGVWEIESEWVPLRCFWSGKEIADLSVGSVMWKVRRKHS